MKNKFIGAVLFLAAGLIASAATAQGYDPFCMDQVDRYCGDWATHECMAEPGAWGAIDDFCTGDVESMIEDSRIAYEDGFYDEYDDGFADSDEGYYPDTTYSTLGGYSYGGQLRAGPGVEYGQVGSLFDGDWIEIVEGTGIWFDGYQWFYVESASGPGFHWGGIMCTEGAYPIEGVFSGCN